MKEHKISYRLIRAFFKYIYIGIYRPKLIDKENIPKEGPVILAGNHVTKIDPCACLLATTRVVHFLAKDKYYDIFGVKQLFQLMNCIRVDSKGKNVDALSSAYEVLNNNGVIGIFPEGTRNLEKNGELLPFKYGTVKMASKCNATIVPFAIKVGSRFKTMRQTIIFGKPYNLESSDLKKEKTKLEENIAALIKENS